MQVVCFISLMKAPEICPESLLSDKFTNFSRIPQIGDRCRLVLTSISCGQLAGDEGGVTAPEGDEGAVGPLLDYSARVHEKY